MGRWLSRALFGLVVFDEGDECRAFQYRFLLGVQPAGALATGMLLLGKSNQTNRIESPHVALMAAFTAVSLLLWWSLQGHRHRVQPVAFAYPAACELKYLLALLYVPQDEMRVLWFLTHIPGVSVYLLLVNPHLGAPHRAGQCRAFSWIWQTSGNLILRVLAPGASP
jgi:hypothetical protein